MLLISAGHLSATQNPAWAEKAFDRANAQYQKGDFASAQQDYLQLLASGVANGSIYYNLGNACFKQKKLGEAIYYWEKALQKMPGDQDILENLELSNLLIVDRIEIPADPFPFRMVRNIAEWLSLTQLSWLALLLLVAANLLFTAFLVLPSPRWRLISLVSSLGTGLLVLLCAGTLAWRVYDTHFRKEGIVVEQKVEVRSGPDSENTAIFTVHEGIRVRVRSSTAGWHQVVLANGWNGWLPQNCIRIL